MQKTRRFTRCACVTGRPIILFGGVLQKDHVNSTRNRHACVNVDEVKEVCVVTDRWRSLVSVYRYWKKSMREG